MEIVKAFSKHASLKSSASIPLQQQPDIPQSPAAEARCSAVVQAAAAISQGEGSMEPGVRPGTGCGVGESSAPGGVSQPGALGLGGLRDWGKLPQNTVGSERAACSGPVLNMPSRGRG